jgi:putative transposase
VFFLVCDGLKGLPDTVNAVWPATIVQTCLIHLIRNSFRFASRKYWDELSRDLKPIYTAVNAEAAAAALDDLHAKWAPRYPAIIRLWRNAWQEFIPFLDYGACCRLPPQRRERWIGAGRWPRGWLNLLRLTAP